MLAISQYGLNVCFRLLVKVLIFSVVVMESVEHVLRSHVGLYMQQHLNELELFSNNVMKNQSMFLHPFPIQEKEKFLGL